MDQVASRAPEAAGPVADDVALDPGTPRSNGGPGVLAPNRSAPPLPAPAADPFGPAEWRAAMLSTVLLDD